MTRQQELELLAEWLGIEKYRLYDSIGDNGGIEERGWNPSPEGNDTDFLNMVAGRVDILWLRTLVEALPWYGSKAIEAKYKDHANDKLAAIKHAAYQVCLMAAREWKDQK